MILPQTTNTQSKKSAESARLFESSKSPISKVQAVAPGLKSGPKAGIKSVSSCVPTGVPYNKVLY